MNFEDAVRTIRKELIIKDEPLKAYNLLKELNMPEFAKELDISYAMVKHVFDEEAYKKEYDVPAEDCEDIEPFGLTSNPGVKYARYGWVMEEIAREKPKTYLDLACYVGTLPTWAARNGVRSCGVDVTAKVIEVAKKRAEKAGVSDMCEFYNEDITKFDKFKPDMLSALEVFEHVVDPRQFIKHMINLSNGWCYITTPNGPYGDGSGNLGNWNAPSYRGHLRVFNKKLLLNLMKECGAEVGYIDTIGDGLIWVKFRKEIK